MSPRAKSPRHGKKRLNATKSARSTRATWSGDIRVVTNGAQQASAYARRLRSTFRAGVQDQLRDLAKHHIETVAVVNGNLVRAVPVLVNGEYAVLPGAAAHKPINSKRTKTAKKAR